MAAGEVRQTPLERMSVSGNTMRDYERRVRGFQLFMKNEKIACRTLAELEVPLLLYMMLLFGRQLGVDAGKKLLAAIQWLHPSLGRGGTVQLSRVHQALRGWARARPPSMRDPRSWLEACGLANKLVLRGLWSMAVCLLLMFDLYLRPSEAMGLRSADVGPPVKRGEGKLRHWSFTIRPWRLGVPSKTGTFDDTVVLDREDRLFLGPHIRHLHAQVEGDQHLFPFTQADLSREVRSAATSLGLVVTLYQARHGGATSDRVDNVRSLPEVGKRGRWRSDKSLRRYEKHGRLHARLNALPPLLLEHLQACARHMPDVLAGRVRALSL